MFLFDAPLTLREYMAHEKVSLADIFRVVGKFIQGRRDVVVFGAHAVNAYVADPRMTSDIDILSTDAEALAEKIRDRLADEFHIAVRVRPMTKSGAGFRVYQLMKPKNRSLVDVRQEAHLPDSISKSKRDVQFVEPITLIAMKVTSYAARRNQIKGDTDRVDIRRLLARFPKLRKSRGEVYAKLKSEGASNAVLQIWDDFVNERLDPDSDEY
jgi:hypothetical protein